MNVKYELRLSLGARSAASRPRSRSKLDWTLEIDFNLLMDDDIQELMNRARSGDEPALGALLQSQRSRLLRLIALRLDDRLRGRVDADDVLQDVFVEAMGRFKEYLANSNMPLYLWLRFIAMQRLGSLARENLKALKRDVRRECSLGGGVGSSASSKAIALQLAGKWTTPSESFLRTERRAQLQQALDVMEPLDREVIALRHFEQLSNAESARVLGLKEATAAKRYLRAMERLKKVLLPAKRESGGSRG